MISMNWTERRRFFNRRDESSPSRSGSDPIGLREFPSPLLEARDFASKGNTANQNPLPILKQSVPAAVARLGESSPQATPWDAILNRAALRFAGHNWGFQEKRCEQDDPKTKSNKPSRRSNSRHANQAKYNKRVHTLFNQKNI